MIFTTVSCVLTFVYRKREKIGLLRSSCSQREDFIPPLHDLHLLLQAIFYKGRDPNVRLLRSYDPERRSPHWWSSCRERSGRTGTPRRTCDAQKMLRGGHPDSRCPPGDGGDVLLGLDLDLGLFWRGSAAWMSPRNDVISLLVNV